MVTNKGQSKVDQMKAELVKLGEDRDARKVKIDALESELRRSVVAARTDKGADGEKAQAEVERISAEITKLRTDDTFDSIAADELSDQLRTAEVTVRREQWRGRCENVRKLIERRASVDKEHKEPLLALVSQLKERLIELQRLDTGIYGALLELKHPRLRDLATRMYLNLGGLGAVVSARLRPVVESPFSSEYLSMVSNVDPGAGAPFAEEILRALDGIAETVPGEEQTSGAQPAAPAVAVGGEVVRI